MDSLGSKDLLGFLDLTARRETVGRKDYPVYLELLDLLERTELMVSPLVKYW